MTKTNNPRGTGWKSVFDIYPTANFKKGLWKPALFWIVSLIVVFLSDVDMIEILNFTCQTVCSAYPSIIGFILTGHALIIGFSGNDLIKKLVELQKESKTTYPQIVNATFSVIIALMVLTLLVSAFVSFIIKCEISWPFDYGEYEFNCICLLLVLFLLYYSLFSLLDVVINVFNFGQVAHKQTLIELQNEEEQNDAEESKKRNSVFGKIANGIGTLLKILLVSFTQE